MRGGRLPGLTRYLERARFALAAWLLILLVHQLLVLGLAGLLRQLGGSPVRDDVGAALPFDEVHGEMLVDALGRVTPLGLAVPGAPGELLHTLAPAWFIAPSAAGGCCLLVTVMDGASSITAVALVRSLAIVALIAAGFYLRRVGGRRRPGMAGRLLIVYGGLAALTLSWGDPEVEALGVAAAATKLAGLAGSGYDALRFTLLPALPFAMKLTIGVAGAAIGSGLALLVERVPGRRAPGLFVRAPRRRWTDGRKRWYVPARREIRTSLAAGALRLRYWSPVLALLLLVFLAGLRSRVVYASIQVQTDWSNQAEFVPPALDAPPSVVLVNRVPAGFEYRVNGKAQRIRGFGYNPIDRGESPADARKRLLKDFRMMRQAGGNTVTGWSQSRFDETILNAAQEQGLGVVLPFEMPLQVDYDDPAVRRRILDDLGRWVERYKRYPALRMWGMGNEVLHDLLPKNDERRLPAARFLIEAADAIHRQDPDHPVIYREAEDVFLPMLQKAMEEKPADRSWLVIGMNFFTFRLEPAVDQAIVRWPGTPLLISEFGPFAVHPSNRAAAFVSLWRLARKHPNAVLGGLAYVWYQRGPEAVDATFGLVDDNGKPVDSTLSALGHSFLEEASRAVSAPARIERGALP